MTITIKPRPYFDGSDISREVTSGDEVTIRVVREVVNGNGWTVPLWLLRYDGGWIVGAGWSKTKHRYEYSFKSRNCRATTILWGRTPEALALEMDGDKFPTIDDVLDNYEEKSGYTAALNSGRPIRWLREEDFPE